MVTSYRSAEDRDGWGYVVVLADARNAQAARELGFAVSEAAGAEGLYIVLCPGERWPCWDLAHQLAGRPARVGRDPDGYSTFHFVRRARHVQHRA